MVNFGVVMCTGVMNNQPVDAARFGLLRTETLIDVLSKINEDDIVIQTIRKIQVIEQKPIFFGVHITVDGIEFPLIAAEPSKEVSKQMLFNAIHALTTAFFDEIVTQKTSHNREDDCPISDEEIAAIMSEFFTDGKGS